MKTIVQVSALGGQIKACSDAFGEVGMKRKASGVDHHPAKHSHGMKFKSSGNRVIDVNHHPAGHSLDTKTEENPQLPSVKGALIKKPFDIHAPRNAPSLELLDENDTAEDFVAYDGPFAIHAPGPELLAAIDAAEKDFTNKLSVIQTAWKVGKDGVETGTNLVPDAVPRPIARISVTFVAVTLALFVLKSFLSTIFFALGVMGLSYFTFIVLNKDDGPKGGGETTSVEDSLEEARKIMDKYK